MFKKKPKEHAAMDINKVVSKDELEPYKQPMVFLFDVEEEVVEALKELRINSFEGSFGSIIKVNNKIREEKFLRKRCTNPARAASWPPAG